MSGMADKSRELRAFTPALILIAICAFISYVDRGNLSIAAPLLKDELHISVTQLGILLSGFFWTYTAMQFVSGWLVDRFEVSWVMAAGFLVWSLATSATGLVRGFTMLLAMRLILGVGESVMVPAFSKIFSFHLPEHHRGVANGVLQGAVRFGPAVGTLGAGLLMAKYGWRPVFIGIGLTSLAWLPAWISWRPRGGAKNHPLRACPSFGDIVRQRSFWGVCAGHFSTVYLLYFMLTLLPFYLVRERHLSMPSMVKIASVYYTVEALSALTTGWLSDFFIRLGLFAHSGTQVRNGHRTHTRGGCAHGLRAGGLTVVSRMSDCGRYWFRNRRYGYICIWPDAGRPARNRKMDGIAKRLRKPCGCRGPGAHRISCGQDRKFSGATRDHSGRTGGWRPLVGVCGRPRRTSELENRAAQHSRRSLQHLDMQRQFSPFTACRACSGC